jgi:predicted amidohydrolase
MERMPLTRPLQLSKKQGDDDKPIPLPTFDNDIGLKICVDLLTDELATTLLRHNPAELGARASGLQILLLIEAYEMVQQQVRQKLDAALLHGRKERHVTSIEQILDHWLQVLYAVYDRSYAQKNPDSRPVEAWSLQTEDTR